MKLNNIKQKYKQRQQSRLKGISGKIQFIDLYMFKEN